MTFATTSKSGAFSALTATLLAATPTLAQTTPSPSAEGTSDTANQRTSVADLQKLKQNPVSGLKQFVLQANANPNYPDSGQTQGIYSLQAVWPFSISEDYRLVTYTILPVAHISGAAGENSTTGLSDTLINLFVSPKKAGEIVWGLGPTILLPTRSQPELGSNRAALGPAALLYYQKEKWSAGLVLQNGWSLGDASGKNRVNAFGAQYLFSYNLPDGWSKIGRAHV